MENPTYKWTIVPAKKMENPPYKWRIVPARKLHLREISHLAMFDFPPEGTCNKLWERQTFTERPGWSEGGGYRHLRDQRGLRLPGHHVPWPMTDFWGQRELEDPKKKCDMM